MRKPDAGNAFRRVDSTVGEGRTAGHNMWICVSALITRLETARTVGSQRSDHAQRDGARGMSRVTSAFRRARTARACASLRL